MFGGAAVDSALTKPTSLGVWAWSRRLQSLSSRGLMLAILQEGIVALERGQEDVDVLRGEERLDGRERMPGGGLGGEAPPGLGQVP